MDRIENKDEGISGEQQQTAEQNVEKTNTSDEDQAIRDVTDSPLKNKEPSTEDQPENQSQRDAQADNQSQHILQPDNQSQHNVQPGEDGKPVEEIGPGDNNTAQKTASTDNKDVITNESKEANREIEIFTTTQKTSGLNENTSGATDNTFDNEDVTVSKEVPKEVLNSSDNKEVTTEFQNSISSEEERAENQIFNNDEESRMEYNVNQIENNFLQNEKTEQNIESSHSENKGTKQNIERNDQIDQLSNKENLTLNEDGLKNSDDDFIGSNQHSEIILDEKRERAMSISLSSDEEEVDKLLTTVSSQPSREQQNVEAALSYESEYLTRKIQEGKENSKRLDTSLKEKEQQLENAGRKIKDLQIRLIRSARDDEAKDRYVASLETELKDINKRLGEMIDEHHQLQLQQQQQQTTPSKPITTQSKDTTNNSKTCTIL